MNLVKKFKKTKKKFSIKKIFLINTTSDKISIMAICNIKGYHILFYNKMYDDINSKFILLHEFGHLYLNHLDIYTNKYLYLYLFTYIYLILSCLLTLFTNMCMITIIIGMYNIYKINKYHNMEYEADLFACKYVSRKEIYKQLNLFNIWDCKNSYTHPSSINRINKIMNKINK